MVIVDDGTNNFDAFKLRTVSIEYNRILENTQIFSKLHRIGGKYNTMTRICNLMIVPCNPLLRTVIVDDANNNFDAPTLRTVSIEYNRIPYIGYTNILKSTQTGMIKAAINQICTQMLVHCKSLVCMVIVEVGSINDAASTLRTLSSEYNIMLQITPIFSNLHRMGGK
jgi:hypothetical protein